MFFSIDFSLNSFMARLPLMFQIASSLPKMFVFKCYLNDAGAIKAQIGKNIKRGSTTFWWVRLYFASLLEKFDKLIFSVWKEFKSFSPFKILKPSDKFVAATSCEWH